MNEISVTLRRLSVLFSDLAPVADLDDLDLGQVVVPVSAANDAWCALRDAVPETGRWPVIIGGRPALEALREKATFISENLNEGPGGPRSLRANVAEWLRAAEETPFEKWLANQRDPAWRANDFLQKAEQVEKFGGESLGKMYREFADRYKSAEPEVFDPAACEWPEKEIDAVTNLSVLHDAEEALILLLPTTAGWQAPAYVFFGCFNACPSPEVHVALAHWGFRHYDAEVVAVSQDTLELRPRLPPATREDALCLARDLLTYAEAVTLQDQSLGKLASALKNGSVWSCWWD